MASIHILLPFVLMASGLALQFQELFNITGTEASFTAGQIITLSNSPDVIISFTAFNPPNILRLNPLVQNSDNNGTRSFTTNFVVRISLWSQKVHWARIFERFGNPARVNQLTRGTLVVSGPLSTRDTPLGVCVLNLSNGFINKCVSGQLEGASFSQSSTQTLDSNRLIQNVFRDQLTSPNVPVKTYPVAQVFDIAKQSYGPQIRIRPIGENIRRPIGKNGIGYFLTRNEFVNGFDIQVHRIDFRWARLIRKRRTLERGLEFGLATMELAGDTLYVACKRKDGIAVHKLSSKTLAPIPWSGKKDDSRLFPRFIKVPRLVNPPIFSQIEFFPYDIKYIPKMDTVTLMIQSITKINGLFKLIGSRGRVELQGSGMFDAVQPDNWLVFLKGTTKAAVKPVPVSYRSIKGNIFPHPFALFYLAEFVVSKNSKRILLFGGLDRGRNIGLRPFPLYTYGIDIPENFRDSEERK